MDREVRESVLRAAGRSMAMGGWHKNQLAVVDWVHSRKRGKYLKRPRGKKKLDIFEKWKEGQCG